MYNIRNDTLMVWEGILNFSFISLNGVTFVPNTSYLNLNL